MAMRSVFDPVVRRELLERMGRLSADTRPQWGKFNATQMLAHLNNALRMGLGELTVAPKPTPVGNALGRWLLIYKLKWPQGTPTAPELLAPPEGNVDAERARFAELLERTATRPPTAEWPRHPIFGKMKGKDWAALTYKHADHHLRQFGV